MRVTFELKVVSARREEAYNLGIQHGVAGKLHSCPYPSGSSYAAFYLDGIYDA